MAEVSGVGVPGPLGPFVAGFAAELSRQGYKPQPVGKQLGLLAALSGWLAAEGVAVSGLSSDVAERFCAARRAAGHTDRATVRALDPLLGTCARWVSRRRRAARRPRVRSRSCLRGFGGIWSTSVAWCRRPPVAMWTRCARSWRALTVRTAWSCGAWTSLRCAGSSSRCVRGWGDARRS